MTDVVEVEGVGRIYSIGSSKRACIPPRRPPVSCKSPAAIFQRRDHAKAQGLPRFLSSNPLVRIGRLAV